jgi:hypothetical protein
LLRGTVLGSKVRCDDAQSPPQAVIANDFLDFPNIRSHVIATQ